METLPYLAIEKIVQQLTPRDLASCAAVCRDWREVFNQDWMWRPHCDPELEEPLQTIPSVVTPAFVAPDDSTLPLLCPWRLAFMREKHLWENWGRQENIDYAVEDEDVVDSHFLTNNLVVVWHLFHIKILDVSVMPPVSWAELHTSVCIRKYYGQCSVVGSTILIAEGYLLVSVYHVDLTNKSIELKYIIPKPSEFHIVHGHNCMFTSEHKSNKIMILDLNTGKILKEEAFPLKGKPKEIVELRGTLSSSTSDFIAVFFDVVDDTHRLSKLYVYNIKKLMFLSDFVFDLTQHWEGNVELHRKWLAYRIDLTATVVVYDLELKEELFSCEANMVFVCDNSFVCIVDCSPREMWTMLLKSYSPSRKTLSILGTYPTSYLIQTMSNKFFTKIFTDGESVVKLWKVSGKKVKQLDTFFHGSLYFLSNQSCTRTLIRDRLLVKFRIRYYW